MQCSGVGLRILNQAHLFFFLDYSNVYMATYRTAFLVLKGRILGARKRGEGGGRGGGGILGALMAVI